MHVYRPVLEVLMQRGNQDPHTFLRPSRRTDLPDPFIIEGVAEAVPFLFGAITSGLKITIFGDYDCDGALSSAILEATLLRLGATVYVYLPHRDEGYGLSESAVHHFSRSGTRVLVTIDNGINAVSAVHLAQRLGIKVLVIDHHQIETKSPTQAVWSDEFCAAGLAYMVSSALLAQSKLAVRPREAFLASLSRLAAIASIADCVPLVGATRTLTRLGLAELSKTSHAGLRKLMNLGGITDARAPSAEEIAFRIGPRLNAAGRVGHPAQVLRMLKARTPEEQSKLALELDQLNVMRRRLEKEALKELTSMVDAREQAALVVYGAHWRKGLAGILASRARELFGVPTFVLVLDPRTGMAVGSGRSNGGISLIDALRSCKAVLHRYGGHHQAAGVTVAVESVPAFRRALLRYVEEHPCPAGGSTYARGRSGALRRNLSVLLAAEGYGTFWNREPYAYLPSPISFNPPPDREVRDRASRLTRTESTCEWRSCKGRAGNSVGRAQCILLFISTTWPVVLLLFGILLCEFAGTSSSSRPDPDQPRMNVSRPKRLF